MPIVLKKVFVHNLKGIDITIPLGRLIVFTGVSGSGKSSLLFDTIYAEGQRRYLETLSPHARRAIGELPKPALQSATGLAPTIALEQKLSAHTPRSTVGTMTGIYDFLRVLFARAAVPYCPVSGEPVAAQSREKILAKLKTFPPKTKMVLLSPYAKAKKGTFRDDFAEFLRRGFTRARIDGSFVDLSEIEELNKEVPHDIDLVVDRIVQSADSEARLFEAATTALDLGRGFFIVYDPDRDQETLFSEHAYSKKSGLSYPPLRPQDFSFNHPEGMCPECHGLGCSACGGSRLKPYPAAARFCGKRMGELVQMPIEALARFFDSSRLEPLEMQIAEELLKEIRNRLSFLMRVGLSYLSLHRTAPSLSGGEAQRVRLASQIGSGLVGAIYILDEPSIGLHPHDHERLLETLFDLRDLGNSVLIVEHDLTTMHAADWLIDVGPGAGPLGGKILAEGSVKDLMQNPNSITGAYLSGKMQIAIPKKRKLEKKLTILGSQHHNLQKIDVEIPLEGLICITGVSGSGKSSLISETLVPALQNHFRKAKHPVGKHRAIKGMEQLNKIIAVDQSSIGRSPRSTPATYCKLFDGVDFPFKGRTLSDFLKMTVDEALSYFKTHKKLEILQRVGLGYLTLGQNTMTLSGGESQRIKLARELARPSTKRTLYVLDEPSTGLHLHDLKHLIAVLQELIDKGSTVLVIEHNMELVKTADWVIDLGDGALLGEGPPEKIAKLKTPTGKALSSTKKMAKGRTPLPTSPNLKITGARQNNLKNLSLQIAPRSLTVLTGPSGAGKSSLAFDTLFAEGQRRFAETLSAYARAFLKELPHPDVDEIEGLSPVVAVGQKRGGLSAKSTVATMTKLSDLLRLLYTNFLSKEEAAAQILALPREEKIQILIPLPPLGSSLEDLNRQGFTRIRLNGAIYSLDEEIPKLPIETLELVVDRLVVMPESRERLLAALEQAKEGIFIVSRAEGDLSFNLSPTEKTRKIDGLTSEELGKKRVRELIEFFTRIPSSDLVLQIQEKLQLLADLGLENLTLDRSAPTLSCGELQRVRFAGQAGLSSCLYLLEEPTYGLHPRDTESLIASIRNLCKADNTVIVVENDPLFLQKADHVFEFERGKIVARKPPVTIPPLSKRRPYAPDIRVEHASLHNLKDLSFAFPKGAITCLTGRSGAGKSSLLQEIKNRCAASFDSVIFLEQTPLGLTSRADVSTYSGILKWMRDFFASLALSRAKGFEAHHFSSNHPKGMCRTCSGLGFRSIDLQFLPSVRIECEACRGYRLGPASLEVKYHGKHFGQVLQITIAEARELFSAIPQIARRLQVLIDLGLASLRLGQEVAALATGEVQRLRLGAELAKREIGSTLYLLDEPTLGLHPSDLALLIPLFQRLADHKNTLVIAENDPNLLLQADHVIELEDGKIVSRVDIVD